MTSKSAIRSKLSRVSWSTIMALSLCFTCSAPAFGTEPACEPDNPNPQLFPPDSEPFGRSMLQWSEEQWRWIYSVPVAQNPNLTPGADVDNGQHGPVFFLPTSFAANPSTGPFTYKIPRHKAIGYSAVGLINDYPCPDPSFKPAPGQSLFDFLMAGILPLVDTAQLIGTLDGKPLKDLLSYHYDSDRPFYLTGDLSLQQSLDSCVTGSRQPAVSAAYFFIIKELPPGHHELVNTIVTTSGVTYGPFTMNLEVE
jgi:hypothetical protein